MLSWLLTTDKNRSIWNARRLAAEYWARAALIHAAYEFGTLEEHICP